MWTLESLRENESQDAAEHEASARLGFGEFFRAQLNEGDDPRWVVSRVTAWDGTAGEVLGARALAAELSGKLRREGGGLPVTGDWALGRLEGDRVVIQRLLDRRTCLVRRVAGVTSNVQVVVANVDVLLIVTSANSDLNERRLERYLAAAWDSGARPVVVLNKVDLVSEVDSWMARVSAVALGVDVVPMSADTGFGREALESYATPGTTLALVGSSGVGKSSIINAWLGTARQTTGGLDDVERGRHTTTRRALLQLPSGALVVDTPGMREFGLVEVGAGFDSAFEDVSRLSAQCRFADCLHDAEPGCAVRAAVQVGELDVARLASYSKLLREATAMQARTDQRLAQQLKRQHKVRSKAVRSHYQQGHKGR